MLLYSQSTLSSTCLSKKIERELKILSTMEEKSSALWLKKIAHIVHSDSGKCTYARHCQGFPTPAGSEYRNPLTLSLWSARLQYPFVHLL